MSALDFASILDFLETANLTEINWTCNNSDCITVDATTCPGMLNKSALLYTLSFFYIFIFVIGLVANSVVVWVNLQAKMTGYETHLYIFNLAIADLCVVITLPVWVVSLVQHNQWHMGEITCKITHLIFSINLYSSIFFLACMSVDRYLSVAYFTNSSNRKKKIIRRCICILVWLLAFSASLPDTYYLKTVSSNNETYCRPVYPEESFKEWLIGMELISVVLGFLIPFPIIALFYFLLAKTISASSDQERKSNGKIIFSYVVVFLVCWLPYHVAVLLDIFYSLHFIPFSCQMENFLYATLHITQCFSLVHCCVNPILYSFINRNYRYELMKAFIFKYSAKTEKKKSQKEEIPKPPSLLCLVQEQTAWGRIQPLRDVRSRSLSQQIVVVFSLRTSLVLAAWHQLWRSWAMLNVGEVLQTCYVDWTDKSLQAASFGRLIVVG